MRTSRERLEFCQKIFIFLLIASHWNGFIGWDDIAGSSHEYVEGLGVHTESFYYEGCLLLYPGLVQTQSCRCGFLAGG